MKPLVYTQLLRRMKKGETFSEPEIISAQLIQAVKNFNFTKKGIAHFTIRTSHDNRGNPITNVRRDK